jgi:hypothetical protein
VILPCGAWSGCCRLVPVGRVTPVLAGRLVACLAADLSSSCRRRPGPPSSLPDGEACPPDGVTRRRVVTPPRPVPANGRRLEEATPCPCWRAGLTPSSGSTPTAAATPRPCWTPTAGCGPPWSAKRPGRPRPAAPAGRSKGRWPAGLGAGGDGVLYRRSGRCIRRTEVGKQDPHGHSHSAQLPHNVTARDPQGENLAARDPQRPRSCSSQG